MIGDFALFSRGYFLTSHLHLAAGPVGHDMHVSCDLGQCMDVLPACTSNAAAHAHHLLFVHRLCQIITLEDLEMHLKSITSC